MKYKALSLIAILLFVVVNNTEICYGQGVWDAWDRSASSVNHDALTKAVQDAVNKARNPDKPTSKEREEERQYNNRLNEIMNNQSDLLWYMDSDEYGSIIISNFNLREKLKEKIWDNRQDILDMANNSKIKNVIINDPMLRDYYELEMKKLDIRRHPESAINYIKDPQITEVIKKDPELAQILAQAAKKKAEDEQLAEQQRLLRKKQEEENKELARLAEIKRLQEEAIRAKEQEEKIKQEREADINLSTSLSSMIVTPKKDNSTGTVGNISTNIKPYNEIYDDPTLLYAKLDCAVYNTKANLAKAWKNTKIVSKVMIKETNNWIKGKAVSNTTKPVNKTIDEAIDVISPGTNFSAKVRVISAEKEEEENLVQNVMKCVTKGVNISSASNYRQYLEGERQLMECVNTARRDFVDKQMSHLEKLLPVNGVIKRTRKAYKWLSNIAEQIYNKQNNEDEEY